MRSAMAAFLDRKPGEGVAFMPVVEPLAARVGGMSYQSMTGDPAQWSSAIVKTGQLLEVDALVLGFDDTVTAEACGATLQWREDRPELTGVEPLPPADAVIRGRLESSLDALNRLCQTTRNEYCCVATMTGPVTLARQLGITPDRAGDLKPLTVAIAQALCDHRPDLLMFAEGAAISAGDIGMPQRKAYNTLCNVARYFNIPTAVYLRDFTREILPTIHKLNVDFYFFATTADGGIPAPEWFLEMAHGVGGIGVALPFDDAARAIEHARRCRETLAGMNLAFTSPGNLAYDADLNTIRVITTQLRSPC